LFWYGPTQLIYFLTGLLIVLKQKVQSYFPWLG